MDQLNELFDGIEYASYITLDKSLKADTIMGISFLDRPTNHLGFDYDNIMYSSVIREISIDLERGIMNELSKSNRTFIDFTHLELDEGFWDWKFQTIDLIIKELLKFNKKNCVVSTKVATMFMDSQHYSRENGTGKIGDINVYVNTNYSLAKNEFEILLFDDVVANTEYVDTTHIDDPYSNKTNIRYKQSFSIKNSNCIVLLINKQSPAYVEYKTILREDKLKSILDD